VGKESTAEVVREVLQFGRDMAGSKPADPSTGAREAIDVLTTAYKTAVQHLGEPRQSGDSAAMLLQMKQHHDLVMAMIQQKMAAPQDLEAEFGKIERLLNMLEKVRGTPAGGDSNGWTALLASLPAILAAGAQMFQMAMAARVAQPPQNPQRFAANYAPAAAPGPGAAAALPAASAIPEGDVNIMRIVQSGKDALEAFKLGLTGDEFAQLLERKHGDSAYSDLATLGKDNILQALQAYPQVWVEVESRRAEVEKFIDAFLEYGEAEQTPAPADQARPQ